MSMSRRFCGCDRLMPTLGTIFWLVIEATFKNMYIYIYFKYFKTTLSCLRFPWEQRNMNEIVGVTTMMAKPLQRGVEWRGHTMNNHLPMAFELKHEIVCLVMHKSFCLEGMNYKTLTPAAV